MDSLFAHQFISLSLTFGIVALTLGWLIFDLRRKWRQMFGQRASPVAGGAVGEALERVVKVEQRLDIMEPRVNSLEVIGTQAIQKVGFLRFNPFEHTGGDQSFAVALLNHANNGIVISSLYTREGVRVYAKEINNGVSRHQLSEEEQAVLAQALKG